MSGSAIILPKRVLVSLQAQRSQRLPNETGGFVLGMRRGRHIEITGVTMQEAGDQASAYYFERRDAAHQRKAVSAWEASGGAVSLVGDWHSHPYGPPNPSSTDRTAWRDLSSAIGGSAVGIILANGEPGIFLSPRRWSLLGAQRCSLIEETTDEFVFANGKVGNLLSPTLSTDYHPSPFGSECLRVALPGHRRNT